MQDIELRHLRAFVALAEHGHFGRAAKSLSLAQPSLSHTIAQFEERLGRALIDRTNRRALKLTLEGEALLPHLREVLGQLSDALEGVHDTQATSSQPLKVGYIDGEPLAARPAALRAAARDSGLIVAFRRLAWGQELSAVREREVDLCLVRLPLDTGNLGVEVLLTEPRLCCLPRSHALASAERLELRDLAQLPLARLAGADPAWVDHWRGMPLPDGLRPAEGPLVHDPEHAFDIAVAGLAALLIPASMLPLSPPDELAFLPVDDLAPSQLAAVWRGRRSPRAEGFCMAARHLAGEHPTS